MEKEQRDQFNKRLEEDLRMLADFQRFIFVIPSAIATFTANIWYTGMSKDNSVYFIVGLFSFAIGFAVVGIVFYIRIKVRDKF